MENKVFNDVKDWLNCAKQRPVGKEAILKHLKEIKLFLIEEVDEIIEAYENDDRKGQVNGLVDSEWILHNFTWLLDISKDEYSLEKLKVKLSNYSKLCMSMEEALKSVKLYYNGEHPNKMGEKIEACVSPTGNKEYPFAVLRTKDNKVLKSYKFKDVDQF